MLKHRLVSDNAERRAKLTAREIAFALVLSAAAIVSLIVASAKLPEAETASNEPAKTTSN